MIDGVKSAKEFLKTQNIKGVAYFRRVPLEKFTKKELIKILTLIFNLEHDTT